MAGPAEGNVLTLAAAVDRGRRLFGNLLRMPADPGEVSATAAMSDQAARATWRRWPWTTVSFK